MRRLLGLAAVAATAWLAIELPAAASEVRGFEKLRERGAGLRPLIEAAANRHGVDPLLVEALVAVESGFDSGAVSPVGARGLMQLMPATAAARGLTEPFDAAANLEAGTGLLAELLEDFEGDWRLAVAAYNAGAGAVRRAGGIPPFPETRQHVERIGRYLALAGAGGRATVPIALSARSSTVPELVTTPQSIVATERPDGRIVFTNVGQAGRGGAGGAAR